MFMFLCACVFLYVCFFVCQCVTPSFSGTAAPIEILTTPTATNSTIAVVMIWLVFVETK